MSLKETISQSTPIRKASHWYYGLSDRDQNALRLLAVAVGVILLYLLVWLPAQRFEARAEQDLERQSELVGWIRQNEQAARSVAGVNTTAAPSGLQGQSLLSVVGSAAKTHSIELRRFEPEGDSRLRVWLEKVPFNQTLLWLDSMNKSYGIQAEQISVDREETPGIVTARLTLSLR